MTFFPLTKKIYISEADEAHEATYSLIELKNFEKECKYETPAIQNVKNIKGPNNIKNKYIKKLG